MKAFYTEYGLFVISAICVVAVLVLIIQGLDVTKKTYEMHDIYVGVDDIQSAQEINAISNNQMYSINAPVIKMSNEGDTIIPSGEYEDNFTFSSEEEVRNFFIPDDIQILDGTNTYGKTDVISNYEAFDIVVEVYKLNVRDYEIKDKYGNLILDENGQTIIKTGSVYTLMDVYSYKDANCKNLSEIVFENKYIYKLVVNYRYTSDTSLKAETQHIFIRKAIITPLKNN